MAPGAGVADVDVVPARFHGKGSSPDPASKPVVRSGVRCGKRDEPAGVGCDSSSVLREMRVL